MKNDDQAILYFNEGDFEKAEALCSELCNSTHTNDPEMWRLLCATYLKLNRYVDAQTTSQRALELDQDNTEAHYYLGLAFFRQGNLDSALQPFLFVIASDPNIIDCYIHLSIIYNHQRDTNKSIEILTRGHKQAPDNTYITCLLAEVLERTNKLHEAKRLIAKALLQSPNHPTAQIVSARLNIRDGLYNEAEARLLKLLENPDLGNPNLSNIQYLLGKVFDRLGKYKQAFSAFEIANQIAAKGYEGKFNKNLLFDRIYRYKGAMQQEHTREWPTLKYNSAEHDPVFIIGFPRSGTTLTEQILASHSQILTSDEEPILFNTSTELTTPNSFGLGFPYTINNLRENEIHHLRNHYLSQAEKIKAGINAEVFIDKLPLNIIDIGFIMRLFSAPKFILLIRDPRDVCLSCFMQAFTPNNAMANFLTLEDTAQLYAATMDLWIHYTGIFNLDVHLLKYEDLVNNTQYEAQKLLTFMGLEWEDNLLENRHRLKRPVSTPSYQDIASPIYNRAVKRWQNYNDAFSKINNTLQPYIEYFNY